MRRKWILVLTAILLALCLVFAACGETGETSEQGSGVEGSGGQTLPDPKDDPSDEKENQDDQKDDPSQDRDDQKEEEKSDPPAGGSDDPDAGKQKPDAGSGDKEDDHTGDETEEDQTGPAPSETLIFERSGDGYLVTGDEGESENIVIPETYENLPVIGIGESAFAYSRHKADILSVTIPNSVKTIEKNAFYSRHELKEVVIGEESALESVGNNAFSGCRELEEIYLPAGLTVLGDSVFNNCGGLDKITVAAENPAFSGEGNNLIDLKTHTLLRGCNQSVIPNTVTAIGDAAFRRAELTELTIPVSVTSIGKYIIQDSAVTSILFAGTSAQWDAIEKSKSWNLGKTEVKITFSSEDQGNDDQDKSEVSVLVAYFSCTNHTKSVANYIADVTGGTLYEIKPEIPYTSADLNYNSDCRANREQNDDSARPKISGSVENMEEYDVIYLGYPIWWGQAPKIIYTFLESYDLSGKTIVPFCTSGSSSIGSSATNLHSSASGATWLDGRRFSGAAQKSEVEAWIKDLED